MNRRLAIVSNVLAECLNYILFAAVETVLFINLIKMWPQLWRILILVIIPVIFYFLREKCSNILFFFAGHILPVIAVMITYGSDAYERAVFAGGIGILAAISIRRQLSGSEEKGTEAVPVIAAAGLFLGLYLLDYGAGEGKSSGYLIGLLFVYLAGYFLYAYIIGFLNYIDVNNRTAEHIPKKRAFFVSFGMMSAFTLGSLLLTFLMTNQELIEQVGRGIREVIVSIIRFLTSFLPEYQPGEVTVQRTTQIQGEKVTLPPGETSWFVQVLDVILTVFALSLVVLFVGSLLMTLYRMIKNASWGSGVAQEAKEDTEDRVESLFIKERRKKKREKPQGFLAPKTYNQQIRRIYYKTIWQKYRVLKEEKTAKLIKESTPRECCEQLFAEQKEQALLFANLYEKARYATGECSKQEVLQMKACAGILLGRRRH